MKSINILNLFIYLPIVCITVNTSTVGSTDFGNGTKSSNVDDKNKSAILKEVEAIYKEFLRANAVKEEQLNKLSQSLDAINERNEWLEAALKEPQCTCGVEEAMANAFNQKLEEIINKVNQCEEKVDGLQTNNNQLLNALKLSIDKIDKLSQIVSVSENETISAIQDKCNFQTEDLMRNVKENIDRSLNVFIETNKASVNTVHSKISSLDRGINDMDKSMKDALGNLTNNTQILIAGQTKASESLTRLVRGYNCEAALSGNKSSGIYDLSLPQMNLKSFEAYCLRDANGGTPWTIIQRMHKETINFKQDWQAYKNGFGNTSADHWLGLEIIHALTNTERHELWIEAKAKSGKIYSEIVDDFRIGNEREKYKIKSVGGVRGNFRAMRRCLNAIFSTYDTDTNNTLSKYGDAGYWTQEGCYNLHSQIMKSGKFYKNTVIVKDGDDIAYQHIAIRPKK